MYLNRVAHTYRQSMTKIINQKSLYSHICLQILYKIHILGCMQIVCERLNLGEIVSEIKLPHIITIMTTLCKDHSQWKDAGFSISNPDIAMRNYISLLMTYSLGNTYIKVILF